MLCFSVYNLPNSMTYSWFVMTEIEKLKRFLSENPLAKIRDISQSLGLTRREASKILHYNPRVFQKDDLNHWSLFNEAGDHELLVAARMLPPSVTETNSIVVENLDLVERIRDVLKVYDALKVSQIASRLDANRGLVSRTLNSYGNIFEKKVSKEWSIKGDYVDNSTGPDADFSDSVFGTASNSPLPIAAFNEKDRPPQQAVIEARLDRNFLILAPPGTGKTYTLIERLVYAVVESSGEADAGQFLVLSFSRAAVAEIRKRIATAVANGAPNSLRYVQVKTFDAYATWLLTDGDYDLSNATYDKRIKILTNALKGLNLRQTTNRIGRARYLFVDEIQDLVGVRADMVFELVKRILASKGSVTLLGDPHQSLNDWQIDDKKTDSSEFLSKVQSHLDGGLEQLELEESHRYETPEMRLLAASAKLILDNAEMTAKEKFSALVRLIPHISQDQLIEKFNDQSVDALLCRSNGQVFQWLKWHHGQGNKCMLNAGAIGRPWPQWIGESVMHYQQEVMTHQDLVCRVHSNVLAVTAPLDSEIDDFLNNERLVRKNIVNLEELAFRLKYFSPMLEGDSPEKGLVVSTIHKAKGLEYNNVVVSQFSPTSITDEEVRVLYVAITRAKRGITLLPKKQLPFSGTIKLPPRASHYRYSENGIKFNQILGQEDFDLESLFVSENGDVDSSSLIKYLASRRKSNRYLIKPVYTNTELDHQYSLFMIASNELVRICNISKALQKDINAMSLTKENGTWVGAYGKEGAMIDLGYINEYQTIVHPVKAQVLSRHIGMSGIMVFPLIQGFFPLSKATGG